MSTHTDADLDDLLATPQRPGARECATGWALVRLPPETAAKFRLLFGRTDIAQTTLARKFAERGFPYTTTGSIRRHVAGECRACPDAAA